MWLKESEVDQCLDLMRPDSGAEIVHIMEVLPMIGMIER